MSVKESTQTILTYLIINTPGNFEVFGTTERFGSINELVRHYSTAVRDTLHIQLVPPDPAAAYIKAALAPPAPAEHLAPAPATVTVPTAYSHFRSTGGAPPGNAYRPDQPEYDVGDAGEVRHCVRFAFHGQGAIPIRVLLILLAARRFCRRTLILHL